MGGISDLLSREWINLFHVHVSQDVHCQSFWSSQIPIGEETVFQTSVHKRLRTQTNLVSKKQSSVQVLQFAEEANPFEQACF